MSRYVAELARQPAALAAVVGANAEPLRRARLLVHRARRVRLAGLGSSRHAVGYGAAVLDVVAGVAAAVLDAPGAAVPTPAFGADDVLVVASQSGRTPALVGLAHRARRQGTDVVAIVNDAEGDLAEVAGVVLQCGAGTETVVPATGSVTTAMLLLRALAVDVTGDRAEEQVGRLCAAVTVLLASGVHVTEPPVRIVAAGLAGEWVAEEIALKLGEVAGVAASADSAVDHLHGPAALTVPTFALLDPDDPNSGAIARLRRTVAAGPSPTYDAAVPTTGDPTTDPVVRVVAGQLLAASVAELVGADPDDSRGLRKVTLSA